MIINTQNLTSLFTGYNAAFKSGFAMTESEWMKVASLMPSATSVNLYAWLGKFPKLREWIGDRIIKNMKANDYSLPNQDFESTVGVDRNDIRDDVFGVYNTIFQDMGMSAAMHPDEEVFAKLALGATDLCYDGQPFFNASHPIVVDGAASTVSNYDVTGGGALWAVMDTRRPLKPLIWQQREPYVFQALTNPSDMNVFMNKQFLYGVDGRGAAGFGLWQMAHGSLNTLNATNFDAIVTAMSQLKSDEGQPLGIKPNLLVCGPSNRAAARTLLQVERLASGASNPNWKEVDVLVSPQLT